MRAVQSEVVTSRLVLNWQNTEQEKQMEDFRVDSSFHNNKFEVDFFLALCSTVRCAIVLAVHSKFYPFE